MKTGELARRGDVGVETIRYYERRGLLAEPERTATGYRTYSAADLARLRFIRMAVAAGYTLDSIAQLLELRAESSPDRTEAQRITRERITEIDERMAALQRMRTSLTDLLDACERDQRINGCAILETIATGPSEHAS